MNMPGVRQVRVRRIPKIGHHDHRDARYWWACDLPGRPADEWVHWSYGCVDCRAHMARTLVNQGDGPVGESTDNPDGTLLTLCCVVAARYSDDVLFDAIAKARLADGHPRGLA